MKCQRGLCTAGGRGAMHGEGDGGLLCDFTVFAL